MVNIGLVPYIFVLSFYLVFVLLNCDAPENHRKFSGFPALAGGNYPTIGQMTKNENKEKVDIIIFGLYKRICNDCKFAGLPG